MFNLFEIIFLVQFVADASDECRSGHLQLFISFSEEAASPKRDGCCFVHSLVYPVLIVLFSEEDNACESAFQALKAPALFGSVSIICLPFMIYDRFGVFSRQGKILLRRQRITSRQHQPDLQRPFPRSGAWALWRSRPRTRSGRGSCHACRGRYAQMRPVWAILHRGTIDLILSHTVPGHSSFLKTNNSSQAEHLVPSCGIEGHHLFKIIERRAYIGFKHLSRAVDITVKQIE